MALALGAVVEGKPSQLAGLAFEDARRAELLAVAEGGEPGVADRAEGKLRDRVERGAAARASRSAGVGQHA